MVQKKNLKYELEILKSNNKKVDSKHIPEYTYVKKSLIWSFVYIVIALIAIFVVSIYTSSFPFDASLRAFFHINKILL